MNGGKNNLCIRCEERQVKVSESSGGSECARGSAKNAYDYRAQDPLVPFGHDVGALRVGVPAHGHQHFVSFANQLHVAVLDPVVHLGGSR